jgi:NADH-quinone oxidoreductase subunit C
VAILRDKKMTFNEIKQILIAELGESVVLQSSDAAIQPYITVESGQIALVCRFLKNDSRLYFDFLACLTGIDNGPQAETMEVIYHLNSIPYQHQFVLKVIVPRNNPTVPTVSTIWQTANWHEREAYDLVGIVFENHPDLRRILLPTDWIGHPLQKDYQEPDTYHGIVVKY